MFLGGWLQFLRILRCEKAPPDRARSQQDPNHVEVPNLMWLLAEDRAWDWSRIVLVPVGWDGWDVAHL
jgi:hypothetical protein